MYSKYLFGDTRVIGASPKQIQFLLDFVLSCFSTSNLHLNNERTSNSFNLFCHTIAEHMKMAKSDNFLTILALHRDFFNMICKRVFR